MWKLAQSAAQCFSQTTQLGVMGVAVLALAVVSSSAWIAAAPPIQIRLVTKHSNGRGQWRLPCPLRRSMARESSTAAAGCVLDAGPPWKRPTQNPATMSRVCAAATNSAGLARQIGGLLLRMATTTTGGVADFMRPTLVLRSSFRGAVLAARCFAGLVAARRQEPRSLACSWRAAGRSSWTPAPAGGEATSSADPARPRRARSSCTEDRRTWRQPAGIESHWRPSWRFQVRTAHTRISTMFECSISVSHALESGRQLTSADFVKLLPNFDRAPPACQHQWQFL